MESFYERLPEDEAATLDVWLIEPSAQVKAAAVAAQRAFAHLDWIVPTPSHFMHVTLGLGDAGGDAAGVPQFEMGYGGINCFHEAVIAEVAGEGPRELAEALGHDGPLAHLTLGYVREPTPPNALREALSEIRAAELGTQRVEEVLLCRVPASRTTVLQPWTVLERVPLTPRL